MSGTSCSCTIFKISSHSVNQYESQTRIKFHSQTSHQLGIFMFLLAVKKKIHWAYQVLLG